LEIEIEYNVDMIYNDKNVYDYCQNAARQGLGGTGTKIGESEWGGKTDFWQGVSGGRGDHEFRDANMSSPI
jgi:hypothetical protein